MGCKGSDTFPFVEDASTPDLVEIASGHAEGTTCKAMKHVVTSHSALPIREYHACQLEHTLGSKSIPRVPALPLGPI